MCQSTFIPSAPCVLSRRTKCPLASLADVLSLLWYKTGHLTSKASAQSFSLFGYVMMFGQVKAQKLTWLGLGNCWWCLVLKAGLVSDPSVNANLQPSWRFLASESADGQTERESGSGIRGHDKTSISDKLGIRTGCMCTWCGGTQKHDDQASSVMKLPGQSP